MQEGREMFYDRQKQFTKNWGMQDVRLDSMGRLSIHLNTVMTYGDTISEWGLFVFAGKVGYRLPGSVFRTRLGSFLVDNITGYFTPSHPRVLLKGLEFFNRLWEMLSWISRGKS